MDKIDTSVAHPARRYNYWLGGKDHFAADRESGDLLAKAFPTARIAALENRDFLRRGVRELAAAGIRQFLDIGTGLPVPDNTHEIAQRVAPESRVLYVDNDPIVMTHARALTVGTPLGRTDYLHADLREPASILGSPQLRATLDLKQPVALMLIAVLHFIHDDDRAVALVREYLSVLPPGSYLLASNLTLDYAPPQQVAKHEELLAAGRTDARPRSRAEFGRFFDGLDLLEPGIVAVSDWRPDHVAPVRPDLDRPALDRPDLDRPSAADVSIYGGAARLP